MILHFILILISIIIIWLILLTVKKNNIKTILEKVGFTNYNTEINELNK